MQSSSLQAAVKAGCRALAGLGVAGLTPEAFRLAKLNDPDARVVCLLLSSFKYVYCCFFDSFFNLFI